MNAKKWREAQVRLYVRGETSGKGREISYHATIEQAELAAARLNKSNGYLVNPGHEYYAFHAHPGAVDNYAVLAELSRIGE